ncbi:MAG: hypothetical protein JSU08_10985 [Acidobacteria bacterium]|nr:hypothetical protein [Acidobacteriota bacterium]
MSKRLLLTGLLLLACVTAAGPAAAQPAPTRESGTRNVEVDPIRCWWRTSAGAVHVGEQFDLTLTCAVLESDAVSVVVDESRLGNAVVQMAPFEVVSGSHPPDQHEGIRRFFQYEYRIRLINPDAVGQDVRIPDMGLHYRVNSKVAGNTSVQGRDLMYYLPPLVIRVTSLVPDGATDIRDASGASFAAIDTLNFRAGLFNIVGMALFAFAGLVVLVVLIRVARGARKWTPSEQRELSPYAVLGVATRELSAVRSDKAAGWSDELVDRALAATRIAAAGALGRSISQRTAAGDVSIGEGQLIARGPRRGTRRIISAPVTAHDLSRALARLSPADSRRSTIEALREALQTLAAARYGREARNDGALDEALDAASRAASSVRGQHMFPRSLFRKWSAAAAPVESRA